MKRFLFPAACLAALAASLLYSPAPPPPVQVPYPAMEVRVVQVDLQDPDLISQAAREGMKAVRIYQGEGGGSGVPIARIGNKVLILTAKHVVDEMPLFNVATWDGKLLPRISAVVMHPTEDLAMFWVEGDLAPVSIAPNPVVIGQGLLAAGYPLMEGLHLTVGLAGDHAFGMRLMSAPVLFGMSGGPVLDQFGRLVGLNKAVLVMQGKPVPMMSMMQEVVPFLDWINENLSNSLPH